jgi:hypothetical protein
MFEQKPPTGLKAPGRRLWTGVVVSYILTPAELAMLEQAARTADELERLEKAVRALPDLVVTGSMGQPRMHPLLSEVRAHRALLAKLTEQLNLPDIDQQIGQRAGSRQARKAAVARWNRRDDSGAASA